MPAIQQRPNERIDQFLSLIACLVLNVFDPSQPDKVLQHLAANAFPELRPRDIETAISVCRNRGRGSFGARRHLVIASGKWWGTQASQRRFMTATPATRR